MKLERNEIKQLTKILKDITYSPLDFSNSDIVFAIDTSKTKDIGGFDLEFVNNKFGSEKMPEPVLMMNKNAENPFAIAYCDMTYARKFDFVFFCELKGHKLSKKEEEFLSNLDCFLVNKMNILIGFSI